MRSTLERFRVIPCTPCAHGQTCNAAEECASGVCVEEVCQAPTCDDGVQNGNEEAVDCGPGCRPCACDNGVQDGLETDIDCGGLCRACGIGGRCVENSDCPGRCVEGVCIPGCGQVVDDLSVNGTAFSTATWAHFEPGLAHDGNLVTAAWMLGGSIAAASQVHIGYDFGRDVLLQGVRLKQNYSNQCYFLPAVQVQRSADGERWEDVFLAQGLTMEGGPVNNFNEVPFDNDVPARYWRLLAASTSVPCGNPDVWIVSELEWSGCEPGN